MKLLRQEYKYFISNEELAFLRSSLKIFMKLDKNVNKGERFYTIKSLYFDTPYNDNFNEKVDGIYSREKFRIRKYSTSDIIKFESKKKIENVIEKKSEVINFDAAKEKKSNQDSPTFCLIAKGTRRSMAKRKIP